MKKASRIILAVITVIVFVLTVSIGASATHVYNTNEDFDANGKEVIDIRDLVEAEYQSKDELFVLQLQQIILEVEELPSSISGPVNSGGIYLPIVP